MIKFELFGLLIDWTHFGFDLSFMTFTYPCKDGYFRSDAIFDFAKDESGWFLQLFFMDVIGERKYEE